MSGGDNGAARQTATDEGAATTTRGHGQRQHPERKEHKTPRYEQRANAAWLARVTRLADARLLVESLELIALLLAAVAPDGRDVQHAAAELNERAAAAGGRRGRGADQEA